MARLTRLSSIGRIRSLAISQPARAPSAAAIGTENSGRRPTRDSIPGAHKRKTSSAARTPPTRAAARRAERVQRALRSRIRASAGTNVIATTSAAAMAKVLVQASGLKSL